MPFLRSECLTCLEVLATLPRQDKASQVCWRWIGLFLIVSVKALKFIVGGTMALTLGAGAAVRTLDLGTLYSGSLPPVLGGAPSGSSLFTVTFEDGEDASVSGGVDITLKATGLDLNGGTSAAGWWLNFDSPAKVGLSDLALSYKVLGNFGLSSYRLVEDGVSGVGAGYGNFDIGIRFDEVQGRFTQGDSLQLTFVSPSQALSLGDFLVPESSTSPDTHNIVTAVLLSPSYTGEIGGITHAALNSPILEPAGGWNFAEGGGVSLEIGLECQAIEEEWSFYLQNPADPLAGRFQNLSEQDAIALFNNDYYVVNNCPEPSSVMAGVSVMGLGAWGWLRRRQRSTRTRH